MGGLYECVELYLFMDLAFLFYLLFTFTFTSHTHRHTHATTCLESRRRGVGCKSDDSPRETRDSKGRTNRKGGNMTILNQRSPD